MRSIRTWSVLSFALLLAAGPVLADSPWNKLALFKHLEADPNEMYPISEQNGPWMILATTFTGEDAENQARKLIHELRSEYKLPAYSYHKKFEYSKPVIGKGLTRYGEAPKMRYQHSQDFIEMAVLVGDFTSVDDPDAEKALKKLKVAQPKSMAGIKIDPNKQPLGDLKTMQKQIKQVVFKDEKEKRGPLAMSFKITNPLLPNEYFVPKGVDKLVLQMNKDVPHSLLNCPGKYTVRVATFTGHAILLDKKATEALERGGSPKSWLEDAARNAHNMCEELRKQGKEAYEFHDRTSSIVTVGSFNSVGTRRPDGSVDPNPKVQEIVRDFSPSTRIEPGKQAGQPRKINGIPCDLTPTPLEVPQRSISGDYARSVGRR